MWGSERFWSFYLDHNPAVLKGFSKWFSHQGGGSHPRKEKISQAELLGKLDKAQLFAAEVKERLVSYKCSSTARTGFSWIS